RAAGHLHRRRLARGDGTAGGAGLHRSRQADDGGLPIHAQKIGPSEKGDGRMRRVGTGAVGAAALAVALLFSCSSAAAIPAFARKYGLRCTACHEAWPKLNDFGRAFRDNGYQTLLGKDDPVTASPGYWPVAIRLTPHYEFDEVTHVATDQGVRKLRTGGFAGIGIDLLTAGTRFQEVSFLVVPSGLAPDG